MKSSPVVIIYFRKLGNSSRGIVSSQKLASNLDKPVSSIQTKPISPTSSTRSLEAKKAEGLNQQSKRKKEAIVTAQQKIREYQRRIQEMKEQNQAFRQQHYAKIKEYIPLSKTAAITTSVGSLNKQSSQSKKSLTPRQNFKISQELKKRPDVRDGLYYKMMNKKKIGAGGASESLQPLKKDYKQVDDVFRRIEKTSARFTSGFSEQYHDMSNNDTLSSVNQQIKDASGQEIYAETHQIMDRKFRANQDSDQLLQAEIDSPVAFQQPMQQQQQQQLQFLQHQKQQQQWQQYQTQQRYYQTSQRSNPFEAKRNSLKEHFQSYRDFAQFSDQQGAKSKTEQKQHQTHDLRTSPLELSDKQGNSPPIRVSKANQIEKLNYDTQNCTTESVKQQQQFEIVPARSLEPVIYESKKASQISSPYKQNTATTSTQQVEADAFLMLKLAESGDSPLLNSQVTDKNNAISQAEQESSRDTNLNKQQSLGTYLRKSICSHHSNLSSNFDNSGSKIHERKWSQSGISNKVQQQGNQNSDKKKYQNFKSQESELKGHSKKLPLNQAQNSIFKTRQSQLHGSSIVSDQQQARRPQSSSNMNNQDRIIQAPEAIKQAPLVYQHQSTSQLVDMYNHQSSLNHKQTSNILNAQSQQRVHNTEPDLNLYHQNSDIVQKLVQQNGSTSNHDFGSRKFQEQFQMSPQQTIGQRPMSPEFPQLIQNNNMIKTIDPNKQQIDASTYSMYGGYVPGDIKSQSYYNPNLLNHSYSSNIHGGGALAGGLSAMTNLMNQSLSNTYNNIPNIFEAPQSLSQSFTNSAALSPNPMTPMLGQSPQGVSLGQIQKNYVIVQYEYIVQQLNAQIKKLIERNEDYQKALQRQRDGNRPQDNLIATLEKKVQVLEASKAKLQQELAMNQKMQSDNDLGIEEMKQQYRNQNSILENLRAQHNRGVKSQQELRQRNQDLNTRIGSLQIVIQKKDEEIFQLQGEISKLQQEFGNLSQMEQALQNQLAEYHSKRHNLEQAYQEQRTQLFQNQIQIRQLTNQNQNYKIERGNLMHSLQMMQKNVEDVQVDSTKLKKNIQSVEQEKILGAQQVDRMDRQNQRLQREVSRLSNLLQMQKGAFSNLSKNYQNVADERITDKGASPSPQIYPISGNIKPQMAQRSISPFNRDNGQGGIHPPEPEKYTPTPASQNLYTIPGVFSYFPAKSQSLDGRKSLPSSQQPRYIPPNAFKGVKNDQNEINNATHPNYHAPSLSFSSDLRNSRQFNLIKNQDSQISQKHQNDESTSKYDQFRKRQASSEMVGSLLNWGKQKKNNLHSSQMIGQYPQDLPHQQQPQPQPQPKPQQPSLQFSQQQQKNLAAVETSMNEYPLKKLIKNEVNTHVTFPSYEKQQKEKKTIAQIEQKLQQLQLTKKKLQNEYSKIPTKVLKRNLRQRKQQLEQQLDSNDKVINNLKQKLRDLNVYALHYTG